MGAQERIMVDSISPGQYTDISVNMVSPDQTGIYQSQWRMSTPTGLFFGGKFSFRVVPMTSVWNETIRAANREDIAQFLLHPDAKFFGPKVRVWVRVMVWIRG